MTTPLLERAPSLRQAVQAFEQAHAGRGSVLLIAGEAGIGKTSLIDALANHIGAAFGRSARILRGGCDDLLSPRALGPLHDIAARAGGPVREALASGAIAEAAFTQLHACLDTCAVATLLVLEDVHWADAATLDLVKFLGRRVERLPVLLVLSFRDDELAADHLLHRVLGDLPARRLGRIDLQPLSEQGVGELARGAGRPAGGLHRATGGNPFYVTEVLASGLVDAALGVPSTVRHAVHTRIARLTAAQQEVLLALCVLPGHVEAWLARALLGESALPDLEACIERGILTNVDSTFAFRHELARRGVESGLSLLQRRRRHRAVLETMRHAPPGMAASWARLAHHATEAGDEESVLAFAPRAAEEAAAWGAHREAARLLAAALRFSAQAAPALRAELNERWSYEAGLSTAIDASVIEARQQAIQLWRQLGRMDKVGHNLRWLARLHWYLGDGKTASSFVKQAVAVLEQQAAGPDLAWAYATRAQLCMLHNQTEAALDWGGRATALAERLGETETLCHALNTVGTAEVFADRPSGHDKLDRSLALALAHGLHEQAARVYTNASEHAVVSKDHARAERWLTEGLAFDREHDLDAWTHYLAGWLARLRLEQGQLAEAERVARDVLALPWLTPLMRLPALTVATRVQSRRGHDGTAPRLREALKSALATGEVQRVLPIVAALAEHACLQGHAVEALDALESLQPVTGPGACPCISAWDAGEIAVWRQRAHRAAGTSPSEAWRLNDAWAAKMQDVARPWWLELTGDPAASAEAWEAIGAPWEAALAWAHAAQQQESPAQAGLLLARALRLVEPTGATLAVSYIRRMASDPAASAHLPRRQRGPYRHRRTHPKGLSSREAEVLDCLVQGLPNTAIALQMGVALRTVEHHVSAVLAKLAATSRRHAAEIARDSGWVVA